MTRDGGAGHRVSARRGSVRTSVPGRHRAGRHEEAGRHGAAGRHGEAGRHQAFMRRASVRGRPCDPPLEDPHQSTARPCVAIAGSPASPPRRGPRPTDGLSREDPHQSAPQALCIAPSQPAPHGRPAPRGPAPELRATAWRRRVAVREGIQVTRATAKHTASPVSPPHGSPCPTVAPPLEDPRQRAPRALCQRTVAARPCHAKAHREPFVTAPCDHRAVAVTPVSPASRPRGATPPGGRSR